MGDLSFHTAAFSSISSKQTVQTLVLLVISGCQNGCSLRRDIRSTAAAKHHDLVAVVKKTKAREKKKVHQKRNEADLSTNGADGQTEIN